MTVNLTRIYTKLGDAGETHLGDMSRVSKLHARVEAYGTVDELNATLGVALCQPNLPARFAGWLRRMQNDLLDVGADLSVPPAPSTAPAVTSAAADEDGEHDAVTTEGGKHDGADNGEHDAGADAARAPRQRLRVTAAYVEWLEQACDEVNARLQPLRSFVIPGGTPAAAQLHVARTVCRRAERRALAVGVGANPEVVRYLNRLSDLLFILARAAGEQHESLWEPGAHGSGTKPADH